MKQLPPLPAVPKVSLVIPCYNERGYIGKCLASLVAADRTDMELTVLVADGRSTDGTREEIRAFAEKHAFIRLVDNPHRTTPFALNLGLRELPMDVGIILGAHAEVDPGFIRENLRVLSEQPGCGCAGGLIESIYEGPVARRIGTAMTHPFGVGSAHFRTGARSGPVDTVAFGAYRKEVFEEVGYFDEGLDRNQDDEFNYRVQRAGFVLYLDPRIRSRYHVRGSYSKLFRQYFQYGFWKVVVNKKHGTVTTWRQLAPLCLVLWCFGGPLVAAIAREPRVLWVTGIGVAAYLAIGIGMAIRAASQWRDVAGVALAFFILHLSYGLGYMKALLVHVLFRKAPGKRSRSITR